MRKSIEYLNDALNAIGNISDAKKAAILKITPQELNRFRSGERVMTEFTCVMVAKILEIDPLTCVSSANFEKEKNEEKRQIWLDLWNELDSCNKNKD